MEPEQNLRSAAGLLRQRWPSVQFSSVWQSAAREIADQPDFLNAVARIMSDEPIENVARQLESVEKQLKKAPPYRFGPRTIDLDILFVEPFQKSAQNSSYSLTIPHPKMHERRFVLEPLLEVLPPETKHPVLDKTFESLLHEAKNQECCKVEISL